MTIRNIADRLLQDWPAKIVCLALALLLFLFYRMSTLQERYLSVPLYVETNGDIVPASTYPRMVKVSLRGETDSIYPILEQDIVVYVDLTPFEKEGEYRVPMQTRLKGTALEVSPLEVLVEPAELVLRVEHRMARTVPVTPSFKGYPEAGFEFSGYSLSPDSVEVSGPRSLVEEMTDVVTESIELSGRNASFDDRVPLVRRSPLIDFPGDGKVGFQVNISQTTLVKNFDDVPFYFENLDPGLTVETDRMSGSIQLKGTQTDLADWNLPENALTVLCENISAPGVYNLAVHTIIPQPYEVVTSSPETIQLTVRRKTE